MNSNAIIPHRLELLRAFMREHQLDAFIFPSTDPHNGEYVPDHWKGREWISGFNGSAGTAVVTADAAALWTDSRYFIAAAQQLEGTGFELMRLRIEGTPSIAQWLRQQCHGKAWTVGIDGMVSSESAIASMKEEFEHQGLLTLDATLDPLDTIWTDRPPIPQAPAEVQPLCYAGESVAHKLYRVRQAMAMAYADAILITTLDDIAWTLNLRGSDVHCCPVVVSYLLITHTTATLFIGPSKLTDEVRAHLEEAEVTTDDYDNVFNALGQLHEGSIILDPNQVNHLLFHAPSCKVLPRTSPIAAMKATKNEAEIAGYRRAMLRDGIAMVKFLAWLIPAVEKGGQTELSIDAKLTALRAEQPLFRGLSFDTIAGYAHHGAIVHYEATEESDIPLEPKGLLLLDSGAQYCDGTTDITRTIALGPTTEEERRIYTLVLKSHIQLEMVKFPNGACGSQIDAVARLPLWREGLNFLHGTGHGVGSFLNVHEGPHQIRMEWWPAPLHEGMTVTDEPGIYVEGKFGVRIENLLLIEHHATTDFGTFLKMEPLTLCPIDTTPVIASMLTEEERTWLNDYHLMVRQCLSPHLEPHEVAWLVAATNPI